MDFYVRDSNPFTSTMALNDRKIEENEAVDSTEIEKLGNLYALNFEERQIFYRLKGGFASEQN